MNRAADVVDGCKVAPKPGVYSLNPAVGYLRPWTSQNGEQKLNLK